MNFKELEIGMFVKEYGLIVRKGEAGSSKIWKDNDHISFFSLRDSYHGQLSKAVKEGEEFEILYGRGHDKYKEAIQKLIEERCDFIADAENDVDLLRAYKETA